MTLRMKDRTPQDPHVIVRANNLQEAKGNKALAAELTSRAGELEREAATFRDLAESFLAAAEEHEAVARAQTVLIEKGDLGGSR